MKKNVIFLLIVSLLTGMFSSCTGKADKNTQDSTAQLAPSDVVSLADTDGMFSDRDTDADYSDENAVKIDLCGDSAVCQDTSVITDSSTVTLTSEGTYILSGELRGTVIVRCNENAKLRLVLDGASLSCETSSALYVYEADKVFVTLAEGSENTVSNGGSFVAVDENNIDGAIYSKSDITFNGSGSLSVSSPAGHAVVAKDDLVITGGTYSINAAYHGFDVNDSIRISDGSFSVNAGKDAFHCENPDDVSLGYVYIMSGTLDLICDGDGISASGFLQTDGGTYNIVSGSGSENAEEKATEDFGGMGGMGGHGAHGGFGRSNVQNTAESSSETVSRKGLKSAGNMLICGGSFVMDCADDSVHSDADITVSQGSFEIKSGDDAFHADGTLTVLSGIINVSECYEGLEALHIAVNGGSISLYCSDDGLNAAGGTDESGYGGHFGGDRFGGSSSSSSGSIVISAGKLYINAGGDGIDANGSLTITGGYTEVCGPNYGDTATLDYDTSAIVSGGTFIGTGGASMAQSFSESEIGVIALSTGSCSAGTEVSVKDTDGNVLAQCTPELPFSVIIVATSEMEKGETYKVTVGELSEEFSAS